MDLLIFVRLRAAVLGLALISSALVASQALASATLNLIYSGNIDGELEPCGCSEAGNLGGLKRHATLLDQLREADPNAVAVSAGGLITAFTPDEKLTADYILKGMEALRYDGIGVQWTDLAYGEPFLEGRHLPWISSNLKGELFVPHVAVQKADFRITVFSWLDPTQSPMAVMHFDGKRFESDPSDLVKAIRHEKQNGSTTILLTTLPLAQAKETFDLGYVDVLLIKAAYEKYGEPVLEQGTLVLQPGSRGMRLGQAFVTFSDDKRIESFKHTVHPMPPSMADSPRMAAWYEEYNAKVKEAYEESVKQRAVIDAGVSKYVGAEGCASCHPSQYATWEKSKHAAAFDVLMDVNKAFDPACIKCHSVGFNEEGGFVNQLLTKHLSHVQCENCHGAGRDHASSAGQQPLAKAGWTKEQVCSQCHVQKHSPEFKLEDYWPRIAH